MRLIVTILIICLAVANIVVFIVVPSGESPDVKAGPSIKPSWLAVEALENHWIALPISRPEISDKAMLERLGFD
jgi:hypothetical protein